MEKWGPCLGPVLCHRQRVSSTTSCKILKKINFNNFEQIGFKLSKNPPTAFFAKLFEISPTSLESKLETGENCAEFFCCRLKGPQKKLLGMGTGYQLPPTFCTWGLKVGKIAFCALVAPSGELGIIDVANVSRVHC